MTGFKGKSELSAGSRISRCLYILLLVSSLMYSQHAIKGTERIFKHQKLRSACAATQSDQSFCYLCKSVFGLDLRTADTNESLARLCKFTDTVPKYIVKWLDIIIAWLFHGTELFSLCI